MAINLFTQHSRSWQSNRYVYPVISRRGKGLSIGVNLNPDKVCNFDCIYCCVDRKQPSTVREVDLAILETELDHLVELACSGELFQQAPFDSTPDGLRRINDVAFSGDGEPTSYPQFAEACNVAAQILERHHRPDVKLVVITNATLLHRPKIAEALRFLDQHNGEIWAKLDAGTEDYYRLVERTSIPLSRVLENIALAGHERDLVIQSLFMNIHGQPPGDAEITAYIGRLNDLVREACRIKLIQIYTTARGTAESYVTPLDKSTIDALSARVNNETGLNVETYYGPC